MFLAFPADYIAYGVNVNSLEFLKRAIEVIDFPQNDILLYVSLVQTYKYVCPICLAVFDSSVLLKRHIRYEEHETACRYCGKKFTRTDYLLDHIIKKHLMGVLGALMRYEKRVTFKATLGPL